MLQKVERSVVIASLIVTSCWAPFIPNRVHAKEGQPPKKSSTYPTRRVIDFPEDPPILADLYAAVSRDPRILKPRRFISQTKGRIVVPSNVPLILEYTGGKPHEFTKLISKLRPDSLQCLDISYQRLVEGEVESITALTGLVQLDMQDSTITDADAKHLSKLVNLYCLNLNRTKVGDQALFAAGHMPKLADLNVEYTNVSDNGSVSLSKLPLENLRIGYTKSGAKTLEEIAKLKNLQTLSFSGNKVSAEALKRLGTLSSLRHIRLCDLAPLRSAELISIGKLVTLDHLGLNGTKLNVETLEPLKSLKGLSILELSSCGLTDKQIKGSFQNFNKKLASLNIANNEISDITLMQMPVMQNLTQLDLSRTRVTELGLRYLKKQPCLTLVRLDFTNISDSAVPVIESFAPQVKFSIQTTKISSSNLARLARANRLARTKIL